MNTPVRGKALLFSFLIGLIGLLGAFSEVLLMLLPALMGFVFAAWGSVCFALSATVAVAGVVAVLGVQPQAVYAVAMFLPASFLIGAALKHKRAYRGAVAGSAACIGVASFLQLCLPSILAGLDPFAAHLSLLEEMAPIVVEATVALGSDITAGQFIALGRILVPQLVMLSIVCGAIVFAFADVLLARLFALKQGVELKPLSKVHDWQVSKDFLYGSIVLVVGVIVVRWLSLKNQDAIAMALECIIAAPYALAGFGFLEFATIYAAKRQMAGRRALNIVMLVLFFPYSLLLLVILGFMDRVFGFRNRYKNRVQDESES